MSKKHSSTFSLTNSPFWSSISESEMLSSTELKKVTVSYFENWANKSILKSVQNARWSSGVSQAKEQSPCPLSITTSSTHTHKMEQVLLPWALQCSPVSFLFLSTLWWLLIQDTINKSKYSLFSILVSNIHYGIYQRQAEKNGTHWLIWPFLKNKWKKRAALHNFFFKLNNFFGATFRSDADKGGYLKWD